MKRSKPMRRTPLGPSSQTRRGRRPSAFARIYGSKARVTFVKGLDCAWCGRGPCDNAHVGGAKGIGYKAGFEHIAPLCRECHQAYDEHRAPFNRALVREFVKARAPEVERLWQHHQHPEPEHVGAIVSRVMKGVKP